MSRVLAVDIGASSYRIIEGVYAGNALSMKELARFKHSPVYDKGHYYWDIYEMRDNLLRVIREVAKQGDMISSIGFDTFGTDFGLLDMEGKLLTKPLAYRDSISDGMYEKYFYNERELYAKTGGTYATASTAHILKGMAEHGLASLERARTILLMPDLLAWLFTGEVINEYTIATTSRLLDIKHRCWDEELILDLGLSKDIFCPLTDSGTIVGKLREEISAGIPNLNNTVVTAVACHDTASAVVTIPDAGDCSFISSGSWSVKGIICDRPYTTLAACQADMCNEGQPGGKYRLISNITGMWILEECVRAWNEKGMKITIPELAVSKEINKEFSSMIYTNAVDFTKPGNMPDKICAYCQRTGQEIPETPAAVMRTVINGLALEYRRHNEQIKEVTGRNIKTLYIVGGGRKNRLLNQCAADASGCKVICGHPEAAAAGNILMQLWAMGSVQSMEEFPSIAGRDVKEEIYEPTYTKKWDKMYEQYLKLID